MEEEKSTRGGKRAGAGRKPTGKQYRVMSVTGTQEELDEIRKKAQKAKMSVSRFVIQSILSR